MSEGPRARSCGQIGVSLLPALLAALLASALALPQPNLFDLDWDERGPFSADLAEERRGAALALDEAPVYHLALQLSGPDELLGRMEARVVNGSEQPWQELWFHLLPNLLGGELTIGDLRVNGSPVDPGYADGQRLLRVDMPSPLEPTGALVVSLDYHLVIPVASRRNYGILAHRGGMLSLAHGYPMLAVFGDEGWDLDRPPPYGDLVHAESAFFRVSVDAPSDLSLASSGRLLGRRVEGARQHLELLAGPVRDFYLAGGPDLEPIEEQAGGVLVRGHAPPESEAGMVEAVSHAAEALRIFERRFGAYPYQELDIVAISTSALGVEFPGIIAIRSGLLSPSVGDLESTVAHEVAHQWFYALVGNDQVSEPWLDESLTQYLTLRYFLDRHGAEGYARFREGLLSRWEDVDRRTVPIGLPVGAYSQREYGAIVYGLGPLVLEWLAGLMGRSEFDLFLRAYIESFAFGLARSEEFRELAAATCSCDLGPFFAKWVAPVAD